MRTSSKACSTCWIAAIGTRPSRSATTRPRPWRPSSDSQGRAEVGRLDRRLAVLAIIAQTAPLLGLLGTVIGFVRTVRAAQASELVSRTVLLDGVTESLVAAAFGLAVAILASVLYSFLRVRLDRLVVDLEAAASQVIGYISTQKERAAQKERAK